MKITSKEVSVISRNLCLDRSKVISILSNCRTIGDLTGIDLGGRNKSLEIRLKNSLISLLYKLHIAKETN